MKETGPSYFPFSRTLTRLDPLECRNRQWTAAGKARVPLMILGLLDVMHAFPGQIPDLDAVMSVADYPCVPKYPHPLSSTF